MTLETVEIDAGERPDGSVIWLHGLGADGHDFEPVVPELGLPPSLALRFVFPHAPVRPVTVNGGIAMRAWYDIVSFDREGPADEAGIRASAAAVDELVQREAARGVDASRIVIAGFSQGGAVAIHAALRTRERLAGLLALSTYLPLANRFDAEVADNADAQDRRLPIFFGHGRYDPILPWQLGRDSAARLERAGYAPEWHDYPVAHGVAPGEVRDIGRWLGKVYADRNE